MTATPSLWDGKACSTVCIPFTAFSDDGSTVLIDEVARAPLNLSCRCVCLPLVARPLTSPCAQAGQAEFCVAQVSTP